MMKQSVHTPTHSGEIYKGSVPTLADSSDRFLDLDTKQSVINVGNMWSSHIHHVMNEPSVGMYRIVEHVRSKVPYMVEQKNLLKTKKVNEKIYDADYALLACKSINSNTPWIFSDSIRLLKNNFVSVPMAPVATSSNKIKITPKQAIQPQESTLPQTQASITTASLSSPTVVTNVQPSTNNNQQVNPNSEENLVNAKIVDENLTSTATPLSSEEAEEAPHPSDIMVDSSQQQSSLDNMISPSAPSQQPNQDLQETEPSSLTSVQEAESSQHVVTQQDTTLQETNDEKINTITFSTPTNDDQVTVPTTTEEANSVSEEVVHNESIISTPPPATNGGDDEWSSLAIQPLPSSSSAKKKKSTKKKKKQATNSSQEEAAAEEEDALTPKTF
ncbi:hypothetical protein C9374_002497 [Naegleria lovaniensis]|uniref:Uncharacterized protein n=1 Tax=Naegleria lovaniensis TaxID=51637 RepID=A0AA88KLL0_NAELO|nr:uncharacterized protein C9374_002497 [Naegleria lovaniensis]KAG2386753.1 hypothetical protein C9374_002497 [Naegleria lovaniensis]